MTPESRRRALGLLCLSQVGVWAATFLSVFLGPFAIKEMTGSFALGGLPFAMYYLSNLLVVFPAGRLMDRVGRAPVLALGHAAGAGGAASVALSLSAPAGGNPLLLMSFLGGLFLLSAGSSIAFLTRVPAADLYPRGERARGIGRLILASFAGSLLGAGAFAALARDGPFAAASGYTAMLPFFFVGILSMVLLSRSSLGMTSVTKGARGSLRSVLARPGVRWTVASNAGAQGGMGGVMSFAGAALMPLGGLVSGAVMLGHFGGMFLPSPVAGRLADRVSRSTCILMGGLVLGLGAALFVRTDLVWLAGVGLFCVGAGWCLTYIPGSAILADATSFEERGTLFGTNDAVVSLFGATMTILAGFLYAGWGVLGLAFLGLGCGALPFGAGFALRRHRVARAPSRSDAVAPSDEA